MRGAQTHLKQEFDDHTLAQQSSERDGRTCLAEVLLSLCLSKLAQVKAYWRGLNQIWFRTTKDIVAIAEIAARRVILRAKHNPMFYAACHEKQGKTEQKG